ncbi:MFS transporter [Streptomyces sp. NBC_01478]|uniref:MFS transporter n=1 Tax=Streptomyces sp. NBC_01478 TaxID=2903882 RepID=UPI002E3325E3|nr:MFS transporter [Streptomyces sp. NBC_01478]
MTNAENGKTEEAGGRVETAVEGGEGGAAGAASGAPRLVGLASRGPFFLTGFVFASYFVQIPLWKSDFGLSDGQLGMLLMLPIVTGLLAMQATGGLVARFGSSPVVRASALALPLSLVLFVPAGRSGSVVWFGLALAVFGAADGVIDVSMNSHAIAVEKTTGRHIMNSCHAAWSIGSASGSLLGGAAIKAGLSVTAHYEVVGAVMVALALAAGRHLLPASADRTGRRTAAGGDRKSRSSTWTGWSPRLLLLGATGTVVLVCSGVVGNWGGIYLHDGLGSSLATASLAYVAFSACEAGGRLVGDKLHGRYGARALVTRSGAVAVGGLAVVVLAPGAAIAVAGFALLGLGLSVLVPVIFSTVGHGGEDMGTASTADALAKINTMTYSGLLIGPVLVGWCASGLGLRTTLCGLLVLLAATLAAGLRRV